MDEIKFGFSGCIFEGQPPKGFTGWADWVSHQPMTGVKITAIEPSAPQSIVIDVPCGIMTANPVI
jgi:hypothetical protein